MNRQCLKIAPVLAALVILAGGLVASSSAQSIHLRAKVPFDFYVGSVLMPAGVYTVESNPARDLVKFVDHRGNSSAVLTLPGNGERSARSYLVFHRYGSLNFLAQLHWADLNNRTLRETRQELLARSGSIPTRIAVYPTP